MLLYRLKRISERSLQVPVSKCVISLPSFADQFGRRAYLQAAQLAGLEPLCLIHDTTATALTYGIHKTDFSNSEIRVVFVDVGHCHTQVSVVAFDSGGLLVLSHAADRRLGGRDFDEILFKHFSKHLKDKYQIDVSSNAKASIRLKAACEKVKKDLSENGEASMSIECLMDDKDVKGFIKREEFEKLASGLLERMLLPCKNALSDAGVGVDEVQSVELVGSASAIPAITRILSSFFGKEPSRTLNKTECVARGCALQCAMLTRGFKIKNYKVRDRLPYSVGFEFYAGWNCKKSLVSKGELFPTFRIFDVPVRGIAHLSGSWTHTDENGNPLDASQKIGTFTVDSQIKGRPSKWVVVPVDTSCYGGLDECLLREPEWLELELELPDQDNLVERNKDRKNELLAYVYEHLVLLERYDSFATETEREAISNRLGRTARRLYDERVDVTQNDIDYELLKMQKLLEPLVNRFRDEEARRPQAKRELLQCIADNRLAVESLTTYERDAVFNECNKAEQWLLDKSQLQDSLPKDSDPVLWSHEINKMTTSLDASCKQILKHRASSSGSKDMQTD